jgi:hypothetical protein
VKVSIVNLLSQWSSLQMNHVHESYQKTDWDYYITMCDITHLCHIMEDDKICLDNNDAISTWLWVTWLQQDGEEAILKDKGDPPPPGSGVEDDCFILCVQTKFQREHF